MSESVKDDDHSHKSNGAFPRVDGAGPFARKGRPKKSERGEGLKTKRQTDGEDAVDLPQG